MKVLIVLLLLGLSSGATMAQDYFCPRSDILLQGSTYSDDGVNAAWVDFNVVGSGGRGGFFDRTIPHPHRFSGLSGGIPFLKATYCSTKDFLCLNFSSKSWGEPEEHEFVVYLPRNVKENAVYEHRGVKIVTRGTTLGGVSKDLNKSIQAVVHGNRRGKPFALKFTLVAGRGAVFIDGVDIWRGAQGQGETCALMSGDGLFSDFRIE